MSGEPVQGQGVEGEGAGAAEAHWGFEGLQNTKNILLEDL